MRIVYYEGELKRNIVMSMVFPFFSTNGVI